MSLMTADVGFPPILISSKLCRCKCRQRGGGGSVVSLKQDLLLLRFGQGRTGFVATRVSLRALRIGGGSGLQRGEQS
jgi:hypothetical protein